MTSYAHPPGSPKAVKAGCLCPVMDNHNGAGVPYIDGPLYWTDGNCKLHNQQWDGVIEDTGEDA